MEINNEQFGMSIRYAIGKQYQLDVDDLQHRTSQGIVEQFLGGNFLEAIFAEIGVPIKAIHRDASYNTDGITRSPHNFLLTSGKTLSIKTNMGVNVKQCPNVVGQPGVSTFDYHFGDLYEGSIDKSKFKELVISQIDKLIPIYLDYLFISDYTVWIYCEPLDMAKPILERSYKYEIIERSDIPELEWEKNLFSFTKSIQTWNESNTLKYQDTSIGEFQVHKNRLFKFRIDMFKILPFIQKKKETNETLGVSAEFAICKHYGLAKGMEDLKHRKDDEYVTGITAILDDAFRDKPKPVQYEGNKPGNRKKQSKSNVDFILEGEETLSVKTNKDNSYKICPPEIGQPSLATFDEYFADSGLYSPPIDYDKFKDLVLREPNTLLTHYVNHLFDTNYLLWIYLKKKNFKYKHITTDELEGYDFLKDKITFTRDLGNWNESNTLKYNNISLGEFQVHHSRKSLKFRFQFNKLLDLIEMDVY